MEDNFLLKSIATCPGKQKDLVIYFIVTTLFIHYFDSLTNELESLYLTKLDNA